MKRIWMFLAVLWTLNAEAKITMPALFADHMVLQQQSDVRFWGEAAPNRKVRIRPSWSRKLIVTQADFAGRWEARIATPDAGGPYTIEVNDGERLMLDDVLIGEVWLCSGQSNMELPLSGKANQPVAGATERIVAANAATPIRMFTVEKAGARTPQQQCDGRWECQTPEALAATSAVACFFADRLNQTLDVPVGIVISSWGGTAVQAWMSREALAAFKEVDLAFLNTEKPINKPKYKPTMLYNAMLAPLAGYTVKGVLWYQGESNRNDPALYGRLMPAFVEMLRRQWGSVELPFYYVQIAPFDYEGAELVGTALVREVQLQHLNEIPNSGMVVTQDLGDPGCIHPARKREVGERLAWLALSKSYRMQGFDPNTPRFEKLEISDGRIYLTFDCGPEGLAPLGRAIEGFEIAAKDRCFHPAQARIEKNTGRLEVYSQAVATPVAVRYCFHNYATGTLYNRSGIPVSSFRTDHWPIEE